MLILAEAMAVLGLQVNSMDNYQLSNFYTPNVRISSVNPMSEEAIWPKNVEICVTRIPIRKRDGYSKEMMTDFAKKLKGSMVKNGIVFLVCYAPVECKHRPFEVASIMSDAGFNHIDNIVVQKTWYPGKRSEINLVNSHDYVLYFCNGKVWNLDRLPIKQYLNSDDELSCPGNTWTVTTGSLDEKISIDLASLLLKMTDALPGSIVFDPFMGNQSTLEVSLKLGHSFFGFEKPLYKKKIGYYPNERQLKRYKKLIDKLQKYEEE